MPEGGCCTALSFYGKYQCPVPHGVKQKLAECLNPFSCSCKSCGRGRVVYRGSVLKCPRPKPQFALVQPSCLVSALPRADGTCVCALQFTQSALDCMGVEVCRLRSFLQVGHARGGSAGLRWVPLADDPFVSFSEVLSLHPRLGRRHPTLPSSSRTWRPRAVTFDSSARRSGAACLGRTLRVSLRHWASGSR